MNKTIMHINYGEISGNRYGNKTIDDICKMAARIGFDGIEFRGKQPVELENISFREYAEEIAKAKAKYGLSEILFGIGVNDCANPDKEIRAKAIGEAVEKAKIANELCGTTLCNTFGSHISSKISTAPVAAYEFSGSAAATAEDWELTVDSFSKIGKELEKIGVKFAYETHMFYIHDLPAASKKLVDLIGSPAIGINMDYGNTVYFPERPSVEETIDMYGDKLFYTHLKNSSPVPGTNNRMATALSDGEINHRSYLAKLREVGFAGPIGIEAPRGGDRVRYAEEDFAYYKSVMESL
ncbi:MAG: sugar phosphate isomerase/epimerase [Oscillospiraceae bacterium]|nr:sugar phosphate isomerase/epimerase [Oscillospiraceae bacterium]